MEIDKRIFGFFFYFCVLLYGLLYLGYILIINYAYSTYSVVSISAILLPFILLLLIMLVLRKIPHIRNKRSARKKLKFLPAIGAIPVLICMILLSVNEYKTNFTTEKWINNTSERVHIVDNLLNTYDLKEKSQSEIVTLLGPPTETEYFKSENNIVYYLGNERGIISIDSEWLVIEFDGNETVKNYDVLTD
ncbi:hypothetical protein ACM26V_10875 [Salipaludibacillus sp. HK11]|uniref:hypothetical protein n=1 Tax=Salipaludibacillus sp. HK11 TaxID=3394320 RepID=UPI0039FBB6B8